MSARNIFLLIGIVSVVVMLLTFDVSYAELWHHLRTAGYWFWAVVLLWIPIYMMNAWSWYLIINDGSAQRRVTYWRVLRYTISGYALNNVTPVGLLGGEPYRIMELTPYVGAARASSSVILYAMMHIFSHFWFWITSLVLFVAFYWHVINVAVGMLLVLMAVFCGGGVYFFMLGYRNGLAVRALRLFGHLPLVGDRIKDFAQRNNETIERVDNQIAMLHAQHKSTFYMSLLLEYLARVVGCLEVMFILMMLPQSGSVSFIDCMLMQAFMSLFANLMFFIPMQMGTREGGFAIITSTLQMPGANGLLTGLVSRVREFIWDCIGLILMRCR